MGRPIIDLEGRKFGRLNPSNTIENGLRFCVCDCGNECWVGTNKITTGSIKSCGCLRREFKRLAPGRAVRNQILDDYKRGASNRGFEWSLSEAQFDTLIVGECFYCGRPPCNRRKARRMNGDLIFNGIDRLDNNKGYTSDNTVSCCKICNRAKSSLALEDFMSWIEDLKGVHNGSR